MKTKTETKTETKTKTKTKTRVSHIELNRAGLAVVKEAGVSVGDILILTFLWGWSVDDLLNYFPALTSDEMVDAAFDYAARNHDTPEGLFFHSVDIFPLLSATGWL